MALEPGTRLGPYEIVSPIGAGGMGEVYRARDAKLERDVALKVLPAAFARDAERLARFTREARTLAVLNHPHIAAIYGIEGDAIVMELVEGRDLKDLIPGLGHSTPEAWSGADGVLPIASRASPMSRSRRRGRSPPRVAAC